MDPAGDLFVADVFNARVLKYDTPLNPNSGQPGAGDTVADLVIGQNGFSSAAQCTKKRHESATCCANLKGSQSIRSVICTSRMRTAYFSRSSSFEGPADCGSRLRTENFNSYICGSPTSDSLCSPLLPAVDGAGRLFVPDWKNNRLLSYDTPLVSSVATRELGQIDFTHGDANFPGPRSFSYPSGPSLTPAAICTSPMEVECWAGERPGIRQRPAGYLVLGQPDFYSTSCHLLGPPPCSSGIIRCVKIKHNEAGPEFAVDVRAPRPRG